MTTTESEISTSSPTEIRDRWRSLVGLAVPVRAGQTSGDHVHPELPAGNLPVASPSRVRIGSWELSGPIA